MFARRTRAAYVHTVTLLAHIVLFSVTKDLGVDVASLKLPARAILFAKSG